ncbi:hypothetical protein FOQG_11022 [Fusarium oxysporum f. sp. raphani 54005]|uniref:Uncharacterized protein n=2 Tax=Fusarium oxysporum TaxID=5507 RepID=X0BSD8_FUSOX|nr:hypothetical protein FOQG_11022 [Fusarium oxysporum f. sp. raphani 54005]EXL73485.1 hypothetical protein FOPG_11285 [Fusarium oxysporum f. sp. conglutinans race 2 54008]
MRLCLAPVRPSIGGPDLRWGHRHRHGIGFRI